MNFDQKLIEYELINDIACIYLNRPHRLNAIIPQLVEELVQAIDRAEVDQVKTLILSGRGRAFCSGHDLKAAEKSDKNEPKRRAEIQRIQDVTRKIRRAPFPVIAAVHGYALGAGCEFALCCDLIVAERDAEFGFPEVSVGLSVTGGISHILPMTVGLAKAKELLFLGERFTAEKAKELGLINYVVESGQLRSAVMELAIKLSELPQSSLLKAKFVLNNGSQVNIESAFDMEIEHVLLTSNSKEAREAADKFNLRK